MNIKQERQRLNVLLAEYNLAKRQAEDEAKTLADAREKQKDILQAQGILQGIAETVQNSAHKRIAEIVSRCLETVFGEESYEFHVRFEQKRGKTEARMVFSRNGKDVDPVDAAGGGVLDLAAFALRLACLILSRPQKRKLLLLDEPMKHLSAEFRPIAAELLMELAKECGVQVVMVTHSDDFKIGKVIGL